MVPMPPALIRTISPQTYALYSETLDGYGENQRGQESEVTNQNTAVTRLGFEEGLEKFEVKGAALNEWTEGPGLKEKRRHGFFHHWRSLSVYRYATKVELLKVLAYGSAFFLILAWVDNRSKILRLLFLLVMTGFSVSVIALIQRSFEVEKIYGLWEPLLKTDRSFFGPFVNPNHFAGYMVLIIPVAVTLLMRQIERLRPGNREKLSVYFRHVHKRGIHGVLFLFVVLYAMASGLFLSLSMGGILAFTGSMVFLVTVLFLGGGWRRKLALGFLVGLFIALFVFWLGFSPFRSEIAGFTRLFQDDAGNLRLVIWRDSLKMVKDFPLFGTGLGTFAHIYPKYKTFLSDVTVMYPESDFLQVLVETGFLGFGLIAWFFIAFFRALWIRWRWHAGYVAHINPRVMAGLAAGIVALLIHGMADFNLHIPGNALQFAIVMGLAMTVTRERDPQGRRIL
jgi:O-antigen ligase